MRYSFHNLYKGFEEIVDFSKTDFEEMSRFMNITSNFYFHSML